MRPSARLTILIATYNRPRMLAGQLAYLSDAETAATVMVLDSSTDEQAAHSNARAARAHGAGYARHASELQVFAKVALGVADVTTPYCVMLADDDFLHAGELDTLAGYLDTHPDAGAVHGLYAEFHTERTQVHLRKLEYAASDLQQSQPLDRIARLLSGYEALTYSVQRTPNALRAFTGAAGQASILGQELLHSTLTAGLGKVARLKTVTHGRRAGSSMGYRKVHPVEWLAVEPSGLFEAYPAYRATLADVLRSIVPVTQIDDAELARRLDLAHLAYLARYMDPEVLTALAGARPAGMDDDALAEHAWETIAHVGGARWQRPLRGPLLRPLRVWWRRNGLRYALQSRMSRVPADLAIPPPVSGGGPGMAMSVHFQPAFLADVMAAGVEAGAHVASAPQLQALARELGLHEQKYLTSAPDPA